MHVLPFPGPAPKEQCFADHQVNSVVRSPSTSVEARCPDRQISAARQGLNFAEAWCSQTFGCQAQHLPTRESDYDMFGSEWRRGGGSAGRIRDAVGGGRGQARAAISEAGADQVEWSMASDVLASLLVCSDFGFVFSVEARHVP